VLLKTRAIRIRHLDNARANHVTGFFLCLVESFVPHGRQLQLNRSRRQFEFQINAAVGTREVVFANANRRDDQRQSRHADVESVAVERRESSRTVCTNARIGKAEREIQAGAHTFMSAPIADEAAQMKGIFKDKYGVVIYEPAAPELEQWKSLARAVWTQFPGRVSVEKLKELQQLSGSK